MAKQSDADASILSGKRKANADSRMDPRLTPSYRVVTDGNFFRIDGKKFYVKGCTYGPFKPNSRGEHFPEPEQARRDFDQIRELGANTIRTYYLPPLWFMDLAHECGIKIFVDIPWRKHICFLDDKEAVAEARKTVLEVARQTGGHPAIFALSVVNEIPPDVARWHGAQRVEDFIDELISIVKEVDPFRLVTFANFPSTEFLRPKNIDFYCFNVYLHNRQVFENYLARLQTLSAEKPIILGEFGIDSYREGDAHQSEILSWHIESVFRSGLVGTFIFSYTDDWFTGGHQIENWAFGLTDRNRKPKPSFHAVQKQFTQAPYFPLPRWPKVSVVVASYNGGRTLPACLESLNKLYYPDYEVILVDDGSTDNTQNIVKQYPKVVNIQQKNMGLSYARNVGIKASTGEIVAFTDSDCRVDEDWLYYLIGDLLKTDCVAIGGPNYLPPDDSWTAACVSVSPGAPAHVMLDDRTAEHIPGCNMAFYKWVLEEINGFDPIYTKAGDDVDVCWRIMQQGYKIGFSPTGFVWHYRRATVKAYLRQQKGYGEAEALLKYKHPEYFNMVGGSLWRGVIYSAAKNGILVDRPVIYHGVFGSALFQTLYTPKPENLLTFLTTLEWHTLVTLPLVVLAFLFPALWPLPVFTFLSSAILCIIAGWQADLPKTHERWWARPLIASMFFLQPIVRGFHRYWGRVRHQGAPIDTLEALQEAHPSANEETDLENSAFWSESGNGRLELLEKLLDRLKSGGWQSRCDSGWNEWDVEVMVDRFSRINIRTVEENHGGNRKLIRIGMNAMWSFFARIFFYIVSALTLITVGIFAKSSLWWFALLLIPLMGLWIYLRIQKNIRLLHFLIETVGLELNLLRLKETPGKSDDQKSRVPAGKQADGKAAVGAEQSLTANSKP